MKVVYLAHPIRDKRGIWYHYQNHRRAEELTLKLWSLGFAVISPGKNTEHFDGALPDETWLKGDLEILRRCDALILAPGWKNSVGATGERLDAIEHGVPVFEWETQQPEIFVFAAQGLTH